MNDFGYFLGFIALIIGPFIAGSCIEQESCAMSKKPFIHGGKVYRCVEVPQPAEASTEGEK